MSGRRRWIALVALALLTACSSAPITPTALEGLAATEPEAARALELWDTGRELANEFLASSANVTLPRGRFEDAADGLRFVTADEAHPIVVKRTAWGTVCTWFGFEAQERSWGFVVGSRGDGDELYANSLFRDSGGDWRHPVLYADLLLHETAHVVFEEGTVGFLSGCAYYLESIFLFRYRDHTAERLPFAVTGEFLDWAVASGAL